jgi:hypothetical protein
MSLKRVRRSGIEIISSPKGTRSLTDASGLPGPVQTLTGSAINNNQVDISWAAPRIIGDSAVTGYTVSVTPTAGSVSRTGTTASITGLTRNTSYTFTVIAQNAIGNGSAVTSATITTQNFNNATGGSTSVITNYNGTGQTWRVHTFTSNATFTVVDSVNTFRYLVCGGGAGGPGANGIANQTVAGGAYVTYTISGQSALGFGSDSVYGYWNCTLRVRKYPTGEDAAAQTNQDMTYGTKTTLVAYREFKEVGGYFEQGINRQEIFGATIPAGGQGGINVPGNANWYRVEIQQIWYVEANGGNFDSQIYAYRPASDIFVKFGRVSNGYSVFSPGGLQVYQGVRNYMNASIPEGTTGDAANFFIVKGKSQIIGSLNVTSGFSANNKQFKIEHPLNENKWLYHTSTESPRADLIYRGTLQLQNGVGSASIDYASRMTTGTFHALTKNPQLFLQNNESFDRIKGYVQSGSVYVLSENENWEDYEKLIIYHGPNFKKGQFNVIGGINEEIINRCKKLVSFKKSIYTLDGFQLNDFSIKRKFTPLKSKPYFPMVSPWYSTSISLSGKCNVFSADSIIEISFCGANRWSKSSASQS